jgi:thiol-disulfide isomerase/thioredoxin
MDRVTFELVKKGDPDSAKKALEFTKRYQAGIASLRQTDPAPQHFTSGQWSEQMDHAQARSLALESRAHENLGELENALQTARASWAAYPTGDAARSMAGVLVKLNRNAEAIQAYADALTLFDPETTESDRAGDRAHMSALYTKANGSEKGLGELMLQAYDRTAALRKERITKLASTDPNANADAIFDFTLPPINTDKPLALSSLRGKVAVLDFWATWCVPCRAQHPLLEQVKKHFADNPKIVFLPVDADDEPKLAAPFLKEQGWNDPTWYEGGLERKLMIGSIPTVVVLDPAGKVSSRMIGMIEDRFVQMLTDRINEALMATAKP